MAHVSLYALVKEQNANRLSVNHRQTMSWLSRAIELTALETPHPVRIFSSFQSMQFFLPVLARYRKLSQRARIVVYGYPDVMPPQVEGISYVELSADDPLMKEWFIIVNSPDFCNALITEEQSNRANTPHNRRTFKGLLTYDRRVVQQMDDLLSEQDQVIESNPQKSMNPSQRSLLMTMVGHLHYAVRRFQHDPILTRELVGIINQYIDPALV